MSLFGTSGGNNRNTGRGGYHPGTGPFDIDFPVSISVNYTPLLTPSNGQDLRINATVDQWQQFQNLPAYLLGNNIVCSTGINETDSGTFTVTRSCRVYMLRVPSWNVVDTTGWTLYETGKSYITGETNVSVYYKDFTTGTYAYDNNSAMYFWVFDIPVSKGAGSLGSLYVRGTGDTAANTTSGRSTGGRSAQDPFFQGPITYSISSGSLPPGFTLDTATGKVSGTYTASGINTDGQVYTFTIRATDNAPGAKASTDRTYTVTLSVPWLYRQIITTMYMVGGYKDSAAWSNANRFPRSTETCTNLGDGLIDSYNYKSGMCSDNAGYVFGAGGGHSSALNTTSRFNHRTETKGSNPGGPGYNCGNTATAFAADRNRSWTVGDGVSNCFRFTASSESFATIGGGQGGGACQISGETRSLFWGDANRYITHATEAQGTLGFAPGAHSQQKGLSAKTGYGYGGNEGTYNGGYNHRKVNINADSYGTITKIMGNCGEENFAMSQDRGYILGQYDGAQNNNCGRIIYATDAVSSGFTSIQGHGGASSGHCFWRD